MIISVLRLMFDETASGIRALPQDSAFDAINFNLLCDGF